MRKNRPRTPANARCHVSLLALFVGATASVVVWMLLVSVVVVIIIIISCCGGVCCFRHFTYSVSLSIGNEHDGVKATPQNQLLNVLIVMPTPQHYQQTLPHCHGDSLSPWTFRIGKQPSSQVRPVGTNEIQAFDLNLLRVATAN